MLIKRAGDDAVKFLEGGPALDGGGGKVLVLHPAVNGHAELGHLEQAGLGDALDVGVSRDFRQLRVDRGVFIRQLARPAEDFGEVEGLDGDAAGFEQFFAVTDGVEGGGPRADGADAGVLQFAHDVAGGGEAPQIRR